MIPAIFFRAVARFKFCTKIFTARWFAGFWNCFPDSALTGYFFCPTESIRFNNFCPIKSENLCHVHFWAKKKDNKTASFIMFRLKRSKEKEVSSYNRRDSVRKKDFDGWIEPSAGFISDTKIFRRKYRQFYKVFTRNLQRKKCQYLPTYNLQSIYTLCNYLIQSFFLGEELTLLL